MVGYGVSSGVNAKLECGCGNLLSRDQSADRLVSDRVACEECGSRYVLTVTRIDDGSRQGPPSPSA
jgi:DNA-directed RNA polymerase subunit RPC12/RpoP